MENIKISLAGDLGSGKSTVGKILATKLNAECYATGTLQRQIAEEMGMTTLQLNHYSEQHPEIDHKIDEGLKALTYVQKNLIIDSRMAWHFVPTAFSVYLQVELPIAAKRIMLAARSSEKFCTIEEAMDSIQNRKKSEILRYKTLYNVNIQDEKNYNCFINTSNLTPEEVALEIIAKWKVWSKRD